MTVILDLGPELEAHLVALATEQGVSIEQYVSRLLERQLPSRQPLPPAERAALWRAMANSFPHTPPLSDAAISRESIYARDGEQETVTLNVGESQVPSFGRLLMAAPIGPADLPDRDRTPLRTGDS